MPIAKFPTSMVVLGTPTEVCLATELMHRRVAKRPRTISSDDLVENLQDVPMAFLVVLRLHICHIMVRQVPPRNCPCPLQCLPAPV